MTEDKDFSQDPRKVTRRRAKVPKPEVGHCKKAGAPVLRTLREFKVRRQSLGAVCCSRGQLLTRAALPQVASAEGYEPGQQLSFEEVFKVGEKVDIAGTTIGKGFAGTCLTQAQQQAAPPGPWCSGPHPARR